MMWDSPLYAVNVLLALVDKEAALTYSRAEYSKVENLSRDTGGNKSGRRHVVTEGERCQNLTGKPQSHGNTYID